MYVKTIELIVTTSDTGKKPTDLKIQMLIASTIADMLIIVIKDSV